MVVLGRWFCLLEIGLNYCSNYRRRRRAHKQVAIFLSAPFWRQSAKCMIDWTSLFRLAPGSHWCRKFGVAMEAGWPWSRLDEAPAHKSNDNNNNQPTNLNTTQAPHCSSSVVDSDGAWRRLSAPCRDRWRACFEPAS